MDINQISQLINQKEFDGKNSTENNKIDKNKAFTIVLEQMIKSMETQKSDPISGGSDNTDTFMGNSNHMKQMLQVMIEAMQQNTNTSSNQNKINPNAVNEALHENGTSGLDYSVNNLSSLTVGNINSRINNAIDVASKKYNVEKPLIEAVIQQESSYNANSVSSAGAEGLMQLMPDTARSLGVTNPFNTEQNIDGGTKYLRSLLDNFNGNKSLALSAYNGGIGTMEKLSVKSADDINKMPNETISYVRNVMGYYDKYKK